MSKVSINLLKNNFSYSEENWMKSAAMKKLNPTGAFFKVKNHLHTKHKIPKKSLSKFNGLIKGVTKQMLYDSLKDDLR